MAGRVSRVHLRSKDVPGTPECMLTTQQVVLTNDPEKVTCLACRKWLIRREQSIEGGLMADHFAAVVIGLRQAAEGLTQTTAALAQVVEGLRHSTAATKQAAGEHDDIRDTVARLERLVMELIRKGQ